MTVFRQEENYTEPCVRVLSVHIYVVALILVVQA